MIKHLLIGPFGAVLVSGAEVFNLDVVHIPNPLIHPLLERIHGGRFAEMVSVAHTSVVVILSNGKPLE